jgi:hypothetical protein
MARQDVSGPLGFFLAQLSTADDEAEKMYREGGVGMQCRAVVDTVSPTMKASE